MSHNCTIEAKVAPCYHFLFTGFYRLGVLYDYYRLVLGGVWNCGCWYWGCLVCSLCWVSWRLRLFAGSWYLSRCCRVSCCCCLYGWSWYGWKGWCFVVGGCRRYFDQWLGHWYCVACHVHCLCWQVANIGIGWLWAVDCGYCRLYVCSCGFGSRRLCWLWAIHCWEGWSCLCQGRTMSALILLGTSI